MKSRCRLALAIAGWFLFLPPEVFSLYQDQFNVNAPMSDWRKYPSTAPREYSSEHKCREDMIRQAAALAQLNTRWGELMRNGRCVESRTK